MPNHLPEDIKKKAEVIAKEHGYTVPDPGYVWEEGNITKVFALDRQGNTLWITLDLE